MSHDAPGLDAGSEISRADQLYLAQDWAGALPLYESAARAAPALAAQLSVPLVMGHCRIELSDDPGLLALPSPVAATNSAREQYVGKILRARALEMCRAADPLRASQLLRLAATYDRAIADVYRYGFADGRSERSLAAPDDRDPPFIAALDIAELPVEAVKLAHRSKRLLLIYRRFFAEGDPRQGEVINCLATSAERFGLAVTRFEFSAPDSMGIAPALLQAMLELKPDIVFYDNQYPFAKSGEPEILRVQIEAVFAMARERLGVRVVVGHMDAWQQVQVGPDALYRGLGRAFDLVQHCHPGALGIGTQEQAARTYCYMVPASVPAASVASGTVPRACFVGSMSWFNDARTAWWAETARRGLPVDFFETRHHEGEPRSDQAYVDLFVRYQLAINFTRRTGGPTIITGRTLDIPLVGGVLLEEDSADTAFFLKPGVHYVPFTTLDDLAALIPALLADPKWRARLRIAGQRWVETYFTGDYFWAGLLHRLDDLA